MPTAWKCLLPMLREFLPPVMQRTVGNTQITGNLRLRLPRSLHQLHRFLFELFRKSALFFWHDALLSDALFQIYILQESPSSPLSLRAAHWLAGWITRWTTYCTAYWAARWIERSSVQRGHSLGVDTSTKACFLSATCGT